MEREEKEETNLGRARDAKCAFRWWPPQHSPTEPLVTVTKKTIMDDLVGEHAPIRHPEQLICLDPRKLPINLRKSLSAPSTEK